MVHLYFLQISRNKQVNEFKMVCGGNSKQNILLASVAFTILFIIEFVNIQQNVFGRSKLSGQTFQMRGQFSDGSSVEELKRPRLEFLSPSDESGNVGVVGDVNDTDNHQLTNDLTQKFAESSVCKSIFRIVFLKTHKTASTTTAAIFERYAYIHNLTFALKKGKKVFSQTLLFTRNMVVEYPQLRDKTFHMLANHARYNRREMDLVIPNATYITILRRPDDQLESAFGYFEMYRGMKIHNTTNSFKIFVKNASSFYRKKNYAHWEQSRNGMLFDLGLQHSDDEKENKIKDKILQIDREFDLVMIQEYYDESLILLKRLLCWDFENILYLSRGVRSKSHRHEIDKELKETIREWNHGDWLLYDHFNRSFWRKVEDYGLSAFQRDLQYFRTLNRDIYDECVNPNEFDLSDRRVVKLTLKNNSTRCKNLMFGDVTFTKMLRTSMAIRFGNPSEHRR